MTIKANDLAITGIVFDVEDTRENENELIRECKSQLSEYFAGHRNTFSVPINASGTEFQRRVWQHLQLIPYGQTKTYKELAHQIEKPKASRAVGGACNKNPIPIIIPCHRVLGYNGRLVGYAGGKDLKKWLIEQEQNTVASCD